MYRDKTARKSNIATTVELFMMFLLLLVVIVVITLVCMTTREQSLEAGALTDAVICAENTAEVTKEATDAEEAAALLEKMDGVTDIDLKGDTVTARQDGYRIEITLTPEEGSAGTYVDENISIYPVSGDSSDAGEAIYQLHAGSYVK